MSCHVQTDEAEANKRELASLRTAVEEAEASVERERRATAAAEARVAEHAARATLETEALREQLDNAVRKHNHLCSPLTSPFRVVFGGWRGRRSGTGPALTNQPSTVHVDLQSNHILRVLKRSWKGVCGKSPQNMTRNIASPTSSCRFSIGTQR